MLQYCKDGSSRYLNTHRSLTLNTAISGLSKQKHLPWGKAGWCELTLLGSLSPAGRPLGFRQQKQHSSDCPLSLALIWSYWQIHPHHSACIRRLPAAWQPYLEISLSVLNLCWSLKGSYGIVFVTATGLLLPTCLRFYSWESLCLSHQKHCKCGQYRSQQSTRCTSNSLHGLPNVWIYLVWLEWHQANVHAYLKIVQGVLAAEHEKTTSVHDSQQESLMSALVKTHIVTLLKVLCVSTKEISPKCCLAEQ